MEAHRNRMRKLVPEFNRLQEIDYLDLLDQWRVRSPWTEIDNYFGIKKSQRNPWARLREIGLEKRWEKISSLTSTKLSKGDLTHFDAAGLIDFMYTLRNFLQNPILNSQRVWNRDVMEFLKELERLCADGKRDEIRFKSWQKFLDDASCEELVEKFWYAVVVSTVALLSIVCQYLLGYVLKGGTKAYSSGSLDFRDTFVWLLLFQGSYVWIFFRDVAAKRTVYRRSKKDEAGRVLYYYGKYEPRLKPRREKLPGGATIKFNNLPLGGYDSHRDAEIMCQIAGYYCKRDEADIKLRDGSIFTIPPMPEQEQSLFGEDKVRCVAARAKEVFENFQVKNNAIILPSERNAVGVHDCFQDVTVTEEFSLDALWDAADAHPVDSEFVDSLCAVGEGLEGTVTSPSSADLSVVDSLIAVGEGSEGTPPSPSTAEQVVLSMERPQSLHLETSDAGSIAKLEIITQQLKEQLEAERNRRISEHEQHLQREKQLEERISQLELEKEERTAFQSYFREMSM